MRFRPRYSLLTFLLLTAGVAVGIKLWRGPHQISVVATPTKDEIRWLHQTCWGATLNKDFYQTRWEHYYINTWNGHVEEYVIGKPAVPIPFHYHSYDVFGNRNEGFTLPDTAEALREFSSQSAGAEKIVGWIYALPQEHTGMWLTYVDCYFVTEFGIILKSTSKEGYILQRFQQLAIQDIQNSSLRARLVENFPLLERSK